MGGEGKGSVDWTGLKSVSVGELGGGWWLMMVGEAVVDKVLVGGQVGFKSRLGDVVE